MRDKEKREDIKKEEIAQSKHDHTLALFIFIITIIEEATKKLDLLAKQ